MQGHTGSTRVGQEAGAGAGGVCPTALTGVLWDGMGEAGVLVRLGLGSLNNSGGSWLSLSWPRVS